MEQINQLLLYLPVLLLAFTFHEFGHAWVALKQGDDTAARLGRVTLDPRSHIDPIGSILFPVIAALTGAPVLGWAKPVPVDVRKLRNYRTGDILVSLAGVFMNFLLVLAFTLVFAILVLVARSSAAPPPFLETFARFCVVGIAVNVGLIVFNLIPIPPLDGSKVLYHYLPAGMRDSYRQLEQYGFLILWGLVLTNALDFMQPLIGGITGFFLGVASLAA